MGADGDPRVLFVMNLVLSSLFAVVLVSALSFVGVVESTPATLALTAAFLVVVTWVVVLR